MGRDNAGTLANLIDNGKMPAWLSRAVESLIEQAEDAITGTKKGAARKAFVVTAILGLLKAAGIKTNRATVSMLVEIALSFVRGKTEASGRLSLAELADVQVTLASTEG